MTCRQIDGICDMVISGATVEEILDNRLAHLNQMASFSNDDTAGHQRVLNNMQFLSENELAKWQENFMKKWNNVVDR